MRIGYPCTNLTIGVMMELFPVGGPAPQEEVDAGVVGNLAGLARTLEFNEKADLLFFSIDPRLVPDQTGPMYSECLAAIGAYVKEKKMRLMTCPAGPFSTRRAADLVHLAALLDAMGLDATAKIPISISGTSDFPGEYDALPDAVSRRLVIRNDRLHTVDECCAVDRACGVPVAYDHHQGREDPGEAVRACAETWKKDDGVPIVFYGSPCTPSIDPAGFESFLAATTGTDIDVMLQFKDRERSAIIAHQVARDDPRLRAGR